MFGVEKKGQTSGDNSQMRNEVSFRQINRGYYMAARRYEIYLRVLKISLYSVFFCSSKVEQRITTKKWKKYTASKA